MRKTTYVGILIVMTIVVSMASTSYAYNTKIKVKDKEIVIDLTHGAFHTEVDNFVGNLTDAGNNVTVIEDALDWALPNTTDALFMSQPTEAYITGDLTALRDWFGMGGKLLFIGGESDYGGYFPVDNINFLLDLLGADILFGSTSISDAVANDGAAYRAAGTELGTGPVATAVTKGMEAGFILHGPCSIVGFDSLLKTSLPNDYYDLRTEQADGVEILVSYSPDSVSDDSDASDTDLDLYAESATTGNYPAVVYQAIGDSHLVLAGEAIFTDYKKMYDQRTESGDEGYNNGTTYGQMFVNNIVNHFLGGAGVPASVVPALVALGLFGTVAVIVKRRK